ncbi:MAG: hypothetical protein AB7O47_09515 [Flavobacteriales bacterium]
MLFLKSVRVILLLLSISSSLVTVAQKQKILVVPYTRFQFVSEYQLTELASVNNVSSQEVYTEYTNGLKAALTNYKNEHYEFEMISELDYLTIKKQVKYDIEKFNGRKYNSSNLSILETEKLTGILTQNNAQFIMFVNWYAIQKNVHTTYTGDNNKRHPFSLHKLDFDVYNSKKEKIIGKGNVKLNCGDFPSAEMVEEKCLKASSLTPCYNQLISDLVSEFLSLK